MHEATWRARSDTLRDFLDQLFDEYKDTILGDTPPSGTIPLLFSRAKILLPERMRFDNMKLGDKGSLPHCVRTP